MSNVRIGWVAGALLVLGVLVACGGSSNNSSSGFNEFGFDFDRFAYPGIVVVPLDAYQQGRATTAGDNTNPESPIIQFLRGAAETANDDPFIADWDTLIGLASNGRDDRDVMRFYLVYEVMTNPTAGTCVVTIHVFEGLPYDPTRPSIATYTGNAMFGEPHHSGEFDITTPGTCENEAGHRAAMALAAGPHFADGWSTARPQHSS